MNSIQLLGINEKLADISTALASALLEKESEYKDISIQLARHQLALLQKDVLDYSTQDLLKEMDV